MEDNPDATVSRRRLSTELRKARDRAGLTQKQVANDLDWSPSKLLRIENGQVGVSRTDLWALLDNYGITDEQLIKKFVRMAQQSRRQPRRGWTKHRDVLDAEFMVYLGYEGAASVIRQFELTFVPGLLQTEEYAWRVINGMASQHEPESVRKRQLEVRLRRQAIIDREKPPEMFFMLDEAVVRRQIGDDAGITRRQLQRLKKENEKSHVHIHIIPFASGVYLGMLGSFVILEFPEPVDDDLLFVENRRRMTKGNHLEIERYKNFYWGLENEVYHRPLEEVFDLVQGEM